MRCSWGRARRRRPRSARATRSTTSGSPSSTPSSIPTRRTRCSTRCSRTRTARAIASTSRAGVCRSSSSSTRPARPSSTCSSSWCRCTRRSASTRRSAPWTARSGKSACAAAASSTPRHTSSAPTRASPRCSTPRYFVPINANSLFAPGWQLYYIEPDNAENAIEPPADVKAQQDLYRDLLATADPAAQNEKMAADPRERRGPVPGLGREPAARRLRRRQEQHGQRAEDDAELVRLADPGPGASGAVLQGADPATSTLSPAAGPASQGPAAGPSFPDETTMLDDQAAQTPTLRTPDWYKSATRWTQLTLAEDDPVKFDPDALDRHLQAHAVERDLPQRRRLHRLLPEQGAAPLREQVHRRQRSLRHAGRRARASSACT